MDGSRRRAAGLALLAALLLSGAGSGKGSGKGGGKPKNPKPSPQAPAPTQALAKPAGMREIATKHYRIWTDAPGDWPADAVRRMDAFRDGLLKTLPLPWPATGSLPCVVRIYSTQAAALAYMKTRGSHTSRSFIYMWSSAPGMREIVGFCGPDGTPDYDPLMHECVHHYLRERVWWPAPFLNEGLAELFESSDVSPDGTLAPKVQRGWLQNLRTSATQGKPMPLSSLVGIDDAAWDQSGNGGYANAWGFCYFMWTSDPARRERLKKAILSMSPGTPKDSNVKPVADAIRAGGELPALEKEWRAFLAKAWEAERMIPGPGVPAAPGPIKPSGPPKKPPAKAGGGK